MALRHLEAHDLSVVKDVRRPEEYEQMQALTRELAFDDAAWTPALSERVRLLFDGLAPEWNTRDSDERRVPVHDALRRGGVPRGGTCLEIGAGTGLHTPQLLEHFGAVVSIDLSMQMLRLAPESRRGPRICSDASRLPFRDGAVDAVVCINSYLFTREYARVLARSGSIVFVSAIGDQTPIYLAPADVVAALEPVLGDVEALTAEAGPGRWTAVTRQAGA